jgi:hypothetical protein
MRRLLEIIALSCLLNGTVCETVRAQGGSDAYFHREIDTAGRLALARSALQHRRHAASRRPPAGAGFFARLARQDRERGFFHMDRGQPHPARPAQATRTGRQRPQPGSRPERRVHSDRPLGYRPVGSAGSDPPPAAACGYHAPVSDGDYHAPTTGP